MFGIHFEQARTNSVPSTTGIDGYPGHHEKLLKYRYYCRALLNTLCGSGRKEGREQTENFQRHTCAQFRDAV